MAETKALQRVRPGDAITANAWNQLVDQVTRNDIRPATSGLKITKTAFGTTIALTAPSTGLLAITTSSITARSSTTAGTGTVSIQNFDGSTISDSSSSLDVYNYSAVAIGSGKYCWVQNDGGYWWVISVEC